ncbi:MAG: phage portal protein [Henriciella sp.]|nr:phage portal protein [Henriciella sp.]
MGLREAWREFWSKDGKDPVDAVNEAIDAGGRGLSEYAALQVSTVLACVTHIADLCAVPELRVFERDTDGTKKEKTDSKLHRILHRRPNELQTSYDFRWSLSAHAALRGAGLAYKTFDGEGNLLEMWPIPPGNWHVMRDGEFEGQLFITTLDGELGPFDLDSEHLFYLPNRMWERFDAMDALKLAMRSIGLAQEMEETERRLYEKGVRPSGILTTEGKVSPESLQSIKEAFSKSKSSQSISVLDQGFKFIPIKQSASDAQMIENRRMQIEEICRAFGVYPNVVGHSDKTATYASAEAFFAADEAKTKRKWQTLWLQRLDEFVLDGAGPLFCQFDSNPLTLAPMKDQAAFVKTALGHGNGQAFLTPDEIREKYGYDPLGGVAAELPTPVAPSEEPTEPEEGPDDDSSQAD